MMTLRIAALLLIGASQLVIASPAAAQDRSINPGINRSYENPDVKQFVERFEQAGRDVYDHRQAVVESCGIKPGMTVADIGAGTGLFTRMFSHLVGVRGKVYAVDIAENFVKHIEKTAEQAGLSNVIGVVCSQDAVRLPPGSIDLVFICDTYHHFEFPEKTMRSIHRALRPGGTLILIDFHRIEGVSPQWALDHVRGGQEVFTREIEQTGFQRVEEKHDVLKHSYFVRFTRVVSPGGR